MNPRARPRPPHHAAIPARSPAGAFTTGTRLSPQPRPYDYRHRLLGWRLSVQLLDARESNAATENAARSRASARYAIGSPSCSTAPASGS